jgi:hypothetical protein
MGGGREGGTSVGVEKNGDGRSVGWRFEQQEGRDTHKGRVGGLERQSEAAM